MAIDERFGVNKLCLLLLGGMIYDEIFISVSLSRLFLRVSHQLKCILKSCSKCLGSIHYKCTFSTFEVRLEIS